MDERITIQEPAGTTDSYGQSVPDWTDVATVWAKVDDRSGSEKLQADQITAYMNTTFNIRYRTGVDETMRILRIRTGRYYNIRSVKNPDRKRTLDIAAEMQDDPFEEEPGGAFSNAFASAYDNG